jgi:hypothetical protein
MPHVTFVHGIANKPAADSLRDQWLRALSADDGVDLGSEGVTSEMVYWADVLYADPVAEAMAEAVEGATELLEAQAGADDAWLAELPAGERAWVERLGRDLGVEPGAPDAAPGPQSAAEAKLERVPLPWVVKRPLMKLVLRDVHHYLFNEEHTPRPGQTFRVQEEIRRRTLAVLEAAPSRPHVVVSHSMGTVIAYDCLKRLDGCPAVDALMTIGSPLGLDEVQDKLQPEWTRADGFPHERVTARRWVNVFDRLDPVAGFDPCLANDYRRGDARVVDDVEEPNSGLWRHNISKYLGGTRLRAQLRSMLGLPER